MADTIGYNEIRRDPILGRWVIVDTGRPRLPDAYERDERRIADAVTGECPFCPGNEGRTPAEVLAYREDGSAPDRPGWWVRVVPSNHPMLRIEGEMDRVAVGMFDMLRGTGAHEVLIETPEHEREFHELADGQVERILWAYRDRIQDLHKDRRLRYVLVFKNNGFAAGGTIRHSHSQLIATPVTPRNVRRELEGARHYYNFNVRERCVWCDMIKAEHDFGRRIVFENRQIVAFCPYASRFPFETWVLPLRHNHDYTHMVKEEAIDLARAMKAVITKFQRALNFPAYNFMLHTAPNLAPRPGYWTTIADDFHWHFEIIPRLTRVKGFEWGTGFYYNPTPPEMAADVLRNMDA